MMNIQITRYLLFLSMIFIFTKVTIAEENNWQLDEQVNCTLITPKKIMDDGQGETEVWLELNKSHLLIKTKSDIDAEYKDIGIQIDDKVVIPFDSVENTTNALFTQSLDKVIEQFIAGKMANVQLRFWPTWPTTGIKSQSFSLIGFTRAYESLTDDCKSVAKEKSDDNAEQSGNNTESQKDSTENTEATNNDTK